MSLPGLGPIQSPPRWLTTLPILTLAVLVVLDAADVAVYQGHPGEFDNDLLNVIADHPAWAAAHLVAIVLLLLSRTAAHTWAAWTWTTVVLATWGIIQLVQGVTLARPVSLVGPSLVLVIATVCGMIACRWAETAEGLRWTPKP